MRAAALAAFVAVAAGCGSASGVSLDEAADATTADTSRVEMEYDFTAIPAKRSFTMTTRGLFDFPNERGVMSVDGDFATLAGLAEGVSVEEFRLIEKAGYTRWSVKGKNYWVKADVDDTSGDAAELLIPLPGTPTKPTDVLARVLEASTENRKLGTEEVRGTDTTHFRANVDLRKLVARLPAAERPVDDAVEAWGSRFVPVEIWIDGESRLRRITLERADDEATMSTRVELFDYGVDVDVKPPPAEEVISQEEFDKLDGESDLSTGSFETGEADRLPPPGQPGNKESE